MEAPCSSDPQPLLTCLIIGFLLAIVARRVLFPTNVDLGEGDLFIHSFQIQTTAIDGELVQRGSQEALLSSLPLTRQALSR